MSNVVGTAFVFFILLIAGGIALSQLVKTKEINLGNCNWNGTAPQNCSLSTADYLMLNASASQNAIQFTTFTSLNWITGLAVMFAVLLTFIGIVKR